ncbi:DUF418 domain-containing protein [Streptosporangium sp. NBC_01495]|uniref:DUF418 domain-containing protein n=1 Tax=Streptosporangium sp. NBC_01495 TaxID=2903899 RepID=UPI002E35D993|nr:DUF418 domain-containing protein [Streptosporangium sp. NBC_01495]
MSASDRRITGQYDSRSATTSSRADQSQKGRFFGDILGAYGLVGLVLAGFIRREDKVVLRAAAAGLVLHVVILFGFGLLTISAPKGDTPAAMADPIEATVMRLIGWSGMTPTYFAASVVPAFLFGIWAARRRVLEDPISHRDLLSRVAVLGTGPAVAGAVPLMLIDTRIWTPSDMVAVSAYALHSVTGIAGGLAYAAIIGLAVGRMRRGHPGPVVRALAACGQWSLTCYLLQSVIFVTEVESFTIGIDTTSVKPRFAPSPSGAPDITPNSEAEDQGSSRPGG